MKKAQTRSPMTTERPSEVASTTDSVCGMTVDPATAKHRRQHGGKTYVFCSVDCANQFEAEPERYLGGAEQPPEARAHAAGIKIGICGQAPSNYPEFAAFLVEEGIDSISLNPDSFVATVRHVAEVERRQEASARAAGTAKSSVGGRT